ncbi:hypothetical protein OIU84_029488 [Salix udensis]|uniref:RING-type E3 ubiquitin transferase n=1 Tax=Salix udensis TaxID=889485 RepID=A0AAD6K9Z4_9ROSI|nr:hypothetical protein OIU84_029488 [Salix udensis]
MEFGQRKLPTSRKNLYADSRIRLLQVGEPCFPPPIIPPRYPHNQNPPPPPPPTSSPRDPGNHNYGIQTSTIIMACVFSGAVILGIRIFFMKIKGPEINHHIWYINFLGLQQSVIDTITVFKFKKDEGVIDGTECSVCLSEFQEDESLRLLPKCSHAFHIPCIDTWLRSHKNCPLCRAPIVSDSTGAQAPLTASATSDLSPREEPQMENSENNTPSGMNQIAGSSSLNSNIFISRNPRIRSDLADKLVVVEPLRRSVSLDFTAASAIYNMLANVGPGKDQANSDSLLVQPKQPKSKNAAKRGSGGFHKLMKNSSVGRSLQKGPISMKRSLSTSGKPLPSRSSKSQTTIHSF